METFGNQIQQKVANKFCCNICDYNTSRKYNFDKHLTSLSHCKRTEMETNSVAKVAKVAKSSKIQSVVCSNCNKEFKHRSGYWKHKQKCIEPPDKNIIMQLMKENNELKNMIMKVIENGINITNNNNTNNLNSHNKEFNLNFFLNETCKNAMNITDFVESIKLQLTDLMDVGTLGFVEGISNIIVKNLNKLDETERPIHCTDKKRETFYIKDKGQWEKDDQERKKMRRVIKNIAFKNEKLLQKYKEEHPGCNFCESKFADEYSKLVIEAMGGHGNDDFVKEEKIIKNISKATSLNKL